MCSRWDDTVLRLIGRAPPRCPDSSDPRASSTSTSTSRRVRPAGSTLRRADAMARGCQYGVDGSLGRAPVPDLFAHRGRRRSRRREPGDEAAARVSAWYTSAAARTRAGGDSRDCRQVRADSRCRRVVRGVGRARDDRVQSGRLRAKSARPGTGGCGRVRSGRASTAPSHPTPAGHADHADIVDGAGPAQVRGILVRHPERRGRVARKSATPRE